MGAILLFLRAVPIRTWLNIAAGIAAFVAVLWVVNWLEGVGAAKERARLEPQIAELKAENAQIRADVEMERAKYRAEIADWVLKFTKERDDQQAALKAAEDKAAADLKEAKARMPAYVSALAVSRCTVPTGAVLFFNERAADTNGQSAKPAEPSRELADSPSGIPFDSFLGAVTDTQAALKSCRAQVTGWQAFWAQLVAQWAELSASIANAQSHQGG